MVEPWGTGSLVNRRPVITLVVSNPLVLPSSLSALSRSVNPLELVPMDSWPSSSPLRIGMVDTARAAGAKTWTTVSSKSVRLPSLTVSRITWSPAAEKDAVVVGALGVPIVTVPGPLTRVQVKVSGPGDEGDSPSSPEPTRVTASRVSAISSSPASARGGRLPIVGMVVTRTSWITPSLKASQPGGVGVGHVAGRVPLGSRPRSAT